MRQHSKNDAQQQGLPLTCSQWFTLDDIVRKKDLKTITQIYWFLVHWFILWPSGPAAFFTNTSKDHCLLHPKSMPYYVAGTLIPI